MPSRKDELAERRFVKLVDQVKAMMSGCLKPEYRGFYGQLVLTHVEVAELGELTEVRRAARAAGRRLGWKVHTYVADEGTLIIIDDRDPPQEIRELAARRSADAVSAVLARAQAEARMFRTSAPSSFPSRPGRPDKRDNAGEDI